MSTPDHPPLHVAVVLPPAPYAIATSGFLATLAAVETEIAGIKITDTESAQQAATIQSRLTSAGSALEKQRKALKDPFIEAGRAIDAAARGPSDRIEAAKNAVKAKLAAFDAEQRRIAAEAERARQEELRKLREKAEAEAAEARRKQAAADAESARLAAESAVPVMDMDDDEPVAPTETAKALAALEQAPAVVAPKPVGVSIRVLLVATVEDVNKLPPEFVTKTANMAALQAKYCAGFKDGDPVPEVAGVRFEVSRAPVSTGRPVF